MLSTRRPNVRRDFRAPGGLWGVGYVGVTFFIGALLLLGTTLRKWRSYPGQLVAGAIVLSGVILYFMWRKIAISI